MENLNLRMARKARATINDSRELELYDYSMFSNCYEVLRSLRNQVVAYRGGVGSEYDELKNKYKKVEEEFNPIMDMCYDGYKTHSEKHRLSYIVYRD